MSNVPTRPPFQFTLSKLFWLVALCTPVIVVSAAEWKTSFPLFTILTAYAVSLAINCLFFGWPFYTPRYNVFGVVIIFTVGLLAYIPSILVLSWLAYIASALLKPLSVRLTIEDDIFFDVGIWVATTVVIVACNLLLARVRRNDKQFATLLSSSHSKPYNDACDNAP